MRIALGTGFTSDAFIFKVQFYRPKSKEQPELPGEPLQEVRNPSIPEIGLMTAMGGLITEPPSDGKPEVKLYEVMTDQKARTVTIKDVEPETGSDDYYHFSLQIKMGGKLYGHDPELINKGGGSK